MASCSRFQASIAIRRCAEALRDKLIEIEGKHIRNMSPRGQKLLGQLPVIEDCLNSGAFSEEQLRELDNDGLQLLLNICINMAKKYHLSSPLKHEDKVKITPSTDVPRTGINIVAGMDSIEFVGFILGYEIADKLRGTKFVTTDMPDIGVSLPWNTIVFSKKQDKYQSGYNPEYPSALTEVGRIRLEVHELWHQIQWKKHPIRSFGKLAIIERIIDFFAMEYRKIERPYHKGDPVERPHILQTIQVLDDIVAFEGQAQFIGQWAADVYAYYSYYLPNSEDSDKKIEYWNSLLERIRKEAKIIIRSGFNSRSASEILLENNNLG